MEQGHMIAKIEKARRIISWIIGVAFLVLVIFSRTPSEGSLFYQILEIFGFIFVISATLGRVITSYSIHYTKLYEPETMIMAYTMNLLCCLAQHDLKLHSFISVKNHRLGSNGLHSASLSSSSS